MRRASQSTSRQRRPQQLALAHAGRDRQGEERLERVTLDGLEEAPRLRRRQRPHLGRRGTGQAGASRRVPVDQPPGDGLFERPVQHRVGVAQRGWGGGPCLGPARAGVVDGDFARPAELGVGAGNVLLRQGSQANFAEGRDQLAPDDAFVALKAARAELHRRHISQPALEQVADGQLGIIDDAE